MDRAVEIRITFMQTFKANLPEGFLDSITKQIITFAWVGKPLKLGTETVYADFGSQNGFVNKKLLSIIVPPNVHLIPRAVR